MTSARAVPTPAGGVPPQPNTSDAPGRPLASEKRTAALPRQCPVCGASLKGRKNSAKFCTGKCRAAGSRLRKSQALDGLLERMKRAEAALHAAADDLAHSRVGIAMKIGKVVLQ